MRRGVAPGTIPRFSVLFAPDQILLLAEAAGTLLAGRLLLVEESEKLLASCHTSMKITFTGKVGNTR